jgi:hypothetical protein
MQAELHRLARVCESSAAARLAGRNPSNDAEFLASLAIATLESLVEHHPAPTGDQDVTSRRRERDEDEEPLRTLIKRTMKRLKRHEAPAVEHSAVAEAKGLELGQYGHTNVFDGDAKKTEKFARLMGGGKGGATEAGHNTYAASASTIKAIDRSLEQQFEAAHSHHGKKGLGAK